MSVAFIEGEVRIEVQDDGLGFDPAVRSEVFGLAGMRERVYLAGGTVELQSGKNGTLVRARLPLQAEDAAPKVGAAASARRRRQAPPTVLLRRRRLAPPQTPQSSQALLQRIHLR